MPYSTYKLASLDYKIFQLLYKNPLLSIFQLSQKLGVSFHTVKSRINEMKRNGFLRQDQIINDPLLGKRIQTEVEIVYRPHRLGLLRTHVFIDGINGRNSLKKIADFCDLHPYTHYNVVTYNPRLSMYIQFDIPSRTQNLLTKVLNILKKEGLFERYTIIPSEFAASSPAEFDLWDFEKADWSFIKIKSNKIDEYNERNIFEKMWSKFDFSSIKEAPKIAPSKAYPFDKLDLYLLREMTINAKASIKELAQYYKKDPSTISRRIKRIKAVLAPKAKLYYNTKLFNLVSPQIILGKFKNKDGFNKWSAYWFIDSHYFKFPSTLVASKKDLIWYLTILPTFIPDFLEFAWEHMSTFRIYNLQIPLSNTYFFYPENFIEEESKWDTSRNWFIEEPLEQLV